MSMVWQPPQPKPLWVVMSYGGSPSVGSFIARWGRNPFGSFMLGPWQVLQPKTA